MVPCIYKKNHITNLQKKRGHNMAKINNIGGVYRYLEWVMWIFYINILWVAFVFTGLIIFGLFPATAAMFAVYRGWFRRDMVDAKITKIFIHTYKKDFLKANAIGYIVAGIGYLLYLNFQFSANIQGMMMYVTQTGLIFFGFVYIIMTLYIFPVWSHFDLKFSDYFKHAVLIGLYSPLMTIGMIIGLIITSLLFWYVPGIVPVIGVSLLAAILMGCALFAFYSIDKKQKEFSESTPHGGQKAE